MTAIDNNSSALEPKRILIVRLGAMGDVIHGLPVAAALRSILPTVEIGWAIEERWAELLTSRVSQCAASTATAEQKARGSDQPLVDNIHLVNTRSWRTGLFSDATWKQARSAVRGLRGRHYDIAIDIQGAWKSATLALLSGAPVRIGFRQPRERGASMFYNRPVIADGTHIIEQNLSLLSAMNRTALQFGRERDRRESSISVGDISRAAPQLPVNEAAESWADNELQCRGLTPGEFAVINPGAGWGAKCWPAERYADIARALSFQGLRSIINFGPGEDEIARSVETNSDGAAQSLCSTIGELTALLRRARLFIGGDTGPMHLAAALRVPVVGIFGPTNPARNGPYATPAVVLRNQESVTDHSRRAAPDAAMLSITSADVISATLALLARTQPASPSPDSTISASNEVRRG